MNVRTIRSGLIAAALALAANSFAAPPAASNARQLPRPAAETVNINTADAETIADVLQGIGPAKANAIVAHRKSHGAFKSVEQLGDVAGIAPKTVERNRKRISVH